jgi:hypothetical protein
MPMPDGRCSHIVTVPHHTGPVLASCPVDCLEIALPGAAFNALARGEGARSGPPRTVGDVIALCEQKRLSEIRGLGPRLIAQIEEGLAAAGLTRQRG